MDIRVTARMGVGEWGATIRVARGFHKAHQEHEDHKGQSEERFFVIFVAFVLFVGGLMLAVNRGSQPVRRRL
jgi:hypothetical protein